MNTHEPKLWTAAEAERAQTASAPNPASSGTPEAQRPVAPQMPQGLVEALLEALPQPAFVVDSEALQWVAGNSLARQAVLEAPEGRSLAQAPAWLQRALKGATGRPKRAPQKAAASATALAAAPRLQVQSLSPVAFGGAPPGWMLVLLAPVSAPPADARDAMLAELRATLDTTHDAIVVTDPQGRARLCNRRAAELFAVPPDVLSQVGRPGAADAVDALMHWIAQATTDPEQHAQALALLLRSPASYRVERIALRSGRILERSMQPLPDDGGAGCVFTFRDVSESLAAHQRIAELARCDRLTGLPNRAELAESIQRAAAHADLPGGSFALLLVDLDRFAAVNDSLGSAGGDEVLVEVGRRMRGAMRHGDLVARVGGDQFALLVHRATHDAAEAAASRVMEAVCAPYRMFSIEFTLTCSVGVAICPQHGRDLDTLMPNAEQAMRAVKGAGRAHMRVHRHDASRPDDEQRRERLRIQHAMRGALSAGEFRLAYQPQIDMPSGRLVGAEALLRWSDTQTGQNVPPDRFIPVAEACGFIVPLGDWVLARAVAQAAEWQRQGHPTAVAVNVSALQFRQADFVGRVASVLATHGLRPSLLELELTESVLIEDADEALDRLLALKALGVKLSIDDFGTGYSSLGYLKRFPIDKLKIDRRFVKGLPADESDAGIVRAIVQMARALGVEVIAEGVETADQRGFLIDAGCTECQGWLYAPALERGAFESRLGTAAAPAG